MRIIVTGDRHYTDKNRVWAVLDELHAKYGITFLAHGCCPTGVDFFADQWAGDRGVPTRGWAANWYPNAGLHGRGRLDPTAGPRRNLKMIAEADATILVAFSGQDGTRDCIAQARRRGLPVIEVDNQQQELWSHTFA